MKTQFGELVTADLHEGTLTIEVGKTIIAQAGKYAIVPIDDYKKLVSGVESKKSVLPIFDVVPSLFKKRRLQLNMSMQKVTDKIGVSKATISRIERGKDAFYENVIRLDKLYSDNGA